MSINEDFWPLVYFQGFRGKSRSFSDSIIAMATTSCETSNGLETCRDESAALELKLVAIGSILVAGVAGVALPLVGRHRRFLRPDGSLFSAAKAFAAGVILATGLVHMLPAGNSALSDPCLPEFPWADFPFAGFFAMVASLATLLVDFVGTQYYERKQGLNRVGLMDPGFVVVDGEEWVGAEDGGGIHVVGVRAHAAHHSHNHRNGQDAFEGSDDEENGARHVVVSQILELGIVSHSVIIGLSLGVSESACTIRPLLVALSFHQFFEGFALGGCISQARFKTLSATVMASFFAMTTPTGIAIGIAISSFYNADSVGALVAEGVLDSLSAGILVYMALVDLIAVDFLSKKMRCNFKLQLSCYCMLVLGAGLMSMLAIWA